MSGVALPPWGKQERTEKGTEGKRMTRCPLHEMS